eukprot:TRINITY_DN2682_c0_g1_i2.p1 TRINITY_DN2682_c0_g1~~TRINITY_DN2682_c0_g1_i2.p1  ORF type:complete len:828 (+),score=206.99 TRINITY_DN2682_c0_g1_i2:120-2486(+)
MEPEAQELDMPLAGAEDAFAGDGAGAELEGGCAADGAEVVDLDPFGSDEDFDLGLHRSSEPPVEAQELDTPLAWAEDVFAGDGAGAELEGVCAAEDAEVVDLDPFGSDEDFDLGLASPYGNDVPPAKRQQLLGSEEFQQQLYAGGPASDELQQAWASPTELEAQELDTPLVGADDAFAGDTASAEQDGVCAAEDADDVDLDPFGSDVDLGLASPYGNDVPLAKRQRLLGSEELQQLLYACGAASDEFEQAWASPTELEAQELDTPLVGADDAFAGDTASAEQDGVCAAEDADDVDLDPFGSDVDLGLASPYGNDVPLAKRQRLLGSEELQQLLYACGAASDEFEQAWASPTELEAQELDTPLVGADDAFAGDTASAEQDGVCVVEDADDVDLDPFGSDVDLGSMAPSPPPCSPGLVPPSPLQSPPGGGGANRRYCANGAASGDAAAGSGGAGYVFLCNNGTQRDCQRYQLLGSPKRDLDKMVSNIAPDTKLFLVNMESWKLVGTFAAVEPPAPSIVPSAFGGKFTAQVKVSPAEGVIREVTLHSRISAGPKPVAEARRLADLLRRQGRAKSVANSPWAGTPTPGADSPWAGSPGAETPAASGPVDSDGRHYDFKSVVVNFANVGATYAEKVLRRDKERGERMFDWEGVRRCVNSLTMEHGLQVVGVVFENLRGPDSGSKRGQGSDAALTLPADIRRACASVEETPRVTGRNHKSADDEMTIKLAYRRNCRFMDNDNYRDWLTEMRNQKIRNWLQSHQELLQMRYFFDSQLGEFDTLDGNIPPELLAMC